PRGTHRARACMRRSRHAARTVCAAGAPRDAAARRVDVLIPIASTKSLAHVQCIDSSRKLF
ncbi:hypothetical protein, partial [Massilia atriviolacea]